MISEDTLLHVGIDFKFKIYNNNIATFQTGDGENNRYNTGGAV